MPEKPLVLVIDDETGSRESMAIAIEKAGFDVRTFDDAKKALDYMDENDGARLAVCDLRMPGMDGVQVLRALRELPSGQRTRGILSTGAALSDATRVAIDELDVEVVPKPYDVEQLRRVVERD